jgi:hypothetical protein
MLNPYLYKLVEKSLGVLIPKNGTIILNEHQELKYNKNGKEQV